MTTQTAISAQSFGTGSNVGNNKFSIAPLTLASGTTAFIVNVQVTNGTGASGNSGQPVDVRVWYTTTVRTVTAGNAPLTLGATARYIDTKIMGGTAAVYSKDSSLEPKTGASFHCWVDAPNLSVAATLDVVLVELPS